MSDVQLGGMLKHVKVKIYQVDVGLGWVYVPDRGAAHTKAWVHDGAQLLWQVWSKGCRGKVVRDGKHRCPIDSGKPRSHFVVVVDGSFSFIPFAMPPFLPSVVSSTF